MTTSRKILAISTVLLLTWTSFCGEELNETDKKNDKASSLMEELTGILRRHEFSAKPYILGEPTQLLMELHSFVTAGPETSIVYTTEILGEEDWKRLCETNAPGAIPVRSRRVVKQRFSEADVATGKARNNEAKRCVVQLFLDGLNNMDDSTAASVLVICSEILDSSQQIVYEANGLEYQEMIESAARRVIEDKTRPLEIRLLAMPFIRTSSRDEKLSLLKALDDELNANDGGMSWEGNREEVQRRIRGMQERITLNKTSLTLQRGDDYYRSVSISSNITAFLSGDVEHGDSISMALRPILSDRLQNETVYADFHRYLQWCVSQFNPETGCYFYRPGHFNGFMVIFCRIGPEKTSWNFYSLAEDGSLKRSLADHPFTEDEIAEGKRRNRSARLALLETIIKGMDCLGGYEQAEMVDVALDFWIRTPKPKDTDINVSSVLDVMAKSGFLHPIAMLHLGKEKYSQKELHEIYCRLLDDSMSPEWEYYYTYVKEAIEFLKIHYPQDLENAETKLSWKRAVIDEALERQANPIEDAEKAENQEIVIDVVL